MTTKIAILHGGPADRVQTVVEHFRPTIYWAIDEPLTVPPTHTRAQLDSIEVHKARYTLVMNPANPRRDTFGWYVAGRARHIPDQEVALYVYVGDDDDGQ